jgi:hypothetical protein
MDWQIRSSIKWHEKGIFWVCAVGSCDAAVEWVHGFAVE